MAKEIPIEEQSQSAVDKLVLRLPGVRALRLPLILPRATNPLSSTLFLVYGFGGLIILGMGLLMLPVASASGQFTSPIDALFTATSAVCLIGLVVVDTGTYWSTFGQAVLLALFQIGGFGFITGATILLLALGGRFGLRDKVLITESIGSDQIGGVFGTVIRIAIFSVTIEAIGAVIFYFHWLSTGDTTTSLWTAVFHAVSAFNNCGMDIFGNFKSLSSYRTDAVVLLVTALMIIIGSTGYVVFSDLAKKRSLFKLSLDSKIVLAITASLLVLGTIFYLFAEFSRTNTLGPLTFPQKIMVAFFQSVTPRSAGFSTVDIGGLSQISLFFTMFLMFIGGAAGSTAGGVKVNTLGVLLVTILNIVRGQENIQVFGRLLTRQTIYRAISLVLFYVAIFGVIVIALSITEVFPLDNLLFEALSALGTAGLTTGITPGLSQSGRIIITIAMFIGRLAPLAFMAFLVRRRQPVEIGYPHETIRLG